MEIEVSNGARGFLKFAVYRFWYVIDQFLDIRRNRENKY